MNPFTTIINVVLIVFAIVAISFMMRRKNMHVPYIIKDSQKINDAMVDDYDMYPGFEQMDSQPENLIPFPSNGTESIGCPIETTERELKEYYRNLYGIHEMSERDRANRAMCDFTDFRSKVDRSSEEFGTDPVDRINALYLSDNNSLAKRGSDITIKEVYDQLTDNRNTLKRCCTRLPDFQEQNC